MGVHYRSEKYQESTCNTNCSPPPAIDCLPDFDSLYFSFQLNVREIVRNELELLFECIDREELTYLPCMDNRELAHLQDFHKYILYKNFGFLQRYAKQKVEQNWTRLCETQRPDSVEKPGNFNSEFEILNFRSAFSPSLQREIAKVTF